MSAISQSVHFKSLTLGPFFFFLFQEAMRRISLMQMSSREGTGGLERWPAWSLSPLYCLQRPRHTESEGDLSLLIATPKKLRVRYPTTTKITISSASKAAQDCRTDVQILGQVLYSPMLSIVLAHSSQFHDHSFLFPDYVRVDCTSCAPLCTP